MLLDLSRYHELLAESSLTKDAGKVTEVTGLVIKGYLPGASLGSLCEIFPSGTENRFLAEVVGFKDRQTLMMPLGEMRGVSLGSRIILVRSHPTVSVSPMMLGRVVDGLGRPMDGLSAFEKTEEVALYSDPRNPLERKPIREPLDVGVRAMNAAITVGRGQRVGVMAGSGVGKSVLLGMLARSSKADINVIALIGERGREVREFIENDLGPEGLKKSVVVVVTSELSPLLRTRGAYVATAIAEYFASMGKNVFLMMDSITRFAMAQREIGLSIGEPPTSKGYTPSVFSHLPKILERAGSFETGSITGLYSVLVEGDDMDDPIGDAVRSIVDGHIVLSRSLAHRNHYPAIDVLQSASRVMRAVTRPDHQKLAGKLREVIATYRDAEDLINIGAYKAGANPKIDRAIAVIDQVNDFLKQRYDESCDFTQTLSQLQAILV